MVPELLTEIFSYFHSPYRMDDYCDNRKQEIRTVTLVSKYWNEVASPMLWDRIFISQETFRQQQQLKHSYGGSVKHVRIQVISWIIEEVKNVLPMIVVTFPNVISLSLFNNDYDALDINLLFKKWTKLQSLRIMGNCYLPVG